MKEMQLETQGRITADLQSCTEAFGLFSEGNGYQSPGIVPSNALPFFWRSMVIKVSNPGLESAPCESVCGSPTAGFCSGRALLQLLSWAIHRSGGLRENNLSFPSS